MTIAVALFRLPSAIGSDGIPVATARPPLNAPMVKMNAPMPAPMPSLSGTGTASRSARRTPSAIATQIASPSSATTPMAPCHERPCGPAASGADFSGTSSASQVTSAVLVASSAVQNDASDSVVRMSLVIRASRSDSCPITRRSWLCVASSRSSRWSSVRDAP